VGGELDRGDDGHAPAILPNLGGSLPNDCFAEVLALPTIWVPHSYPACSQHAPDEHLLATVAREGLMIMTGSSGISASRIRPRAQRNERVRTSSPIDDADFATIAVSRV
jgi:hypothetical protein